MAYCDRCDRYFQSPYALDQHRADSGAHNICDDCEIDFTTWNGLEQHYVQSRRHHYCQRCDEHFDDEDELEEHYDDSHYYCSRCRRFFRNEQGLHDHYRQSDQHHYCVPCRRLFLSASNLISHLNSSRHRPKDVMCPGRGCGLGFVSRSAVVLHLESGKCASGMTREKVKVLVRQYDRENLITDPARMITSPGISSPTYIATPRAWNGTAYECYLCHSTFRTLPALNAHLASPRHEDKIYVCPLASCRTHFSTLSALCQHIESEQCGVHKFRAVQEGMDGLVGKMKRLTV
ncbi:unnamed protein product [Mycena citricolor]|uniref:C2H2-type domain-containing protein n=1 Tax=Mycena citricolor TaxID=2018698 RepID=A0AAD2GX51_9AGAR|nr:unnamed protein product [Mycena citricolor]